MPWIEKERLDAARSVDLLTYLQECEPYELVRSASKEYRTKTHGSLVISNGKWYWNRGQFGGASALDYLIKIRGMSLAEAVEMIEAGGCARASPIAPSLPVKRFEPKHEPKTLTLPPQAKYPSHALTYLQRRGISADVIRRCLASGSIFEARYTLQGTGNGEGKAKANRECWQAVYQLSVIAITCLNPGESGGTVPMKRE